MIYRQAKISDLKSIIELLVEDDLGKTRESLSSKAFDDYKAAFEKITQDKNQHLMVGENADEIVATCHLTIMPSLTFQGSTRLQIEAVRVKKKYRGQKIGEKMINSALDFARKNECRFVQLTTNKQRIDAKRFYEKMGFVASHEGMKFVIK